MTEKATSMSASVKPSIRAKKANISGSELTVADDRSTGLNRSAGSQPNARASAASVLSVKPFLPASRLWTAVVLMPASSASFSWLHPRCLRRSFTEVGTARLGSSSMSHTRCGRGAHP
jgi:hypothetical protein